jgi:hypothetical protein
MSKWTVIDIDKEPSGKVSGGTYAMRVPGGMLIRCITEQGIAMTFVPMSERMLAPNKSVTDQWIEENEIDK